MMQQFPIFVDLHVVPPLIIGDAPAFATGESGDPQSFPSYAGKPAVAVRITSPAAGSSAAVAMADFFTIFFHEFFGASLDKLSVMSQLAWDGVLALAWNECQMLLTDFLGGEQRHEI